jgi:hypothetical protein
MFQTRAGYGVYLCTAVVVLWCMLAPLGASADQFAGKVAPNSAIMLALRSCTAMVRPKIRRR